MARAKRFASRGPTLRPIAVEPVADSTGTRAIVDQRLAGLAAADHHLGQMVGRCIAFGAVALHRALEQALHGKRGHRRLLRRLPHHGVAADEGERRIPRPHRDREVEGRDDADHADRMPGLHHAVRRPLGGDGQAVDLARQADREIADVDHLLDFAEPFGRDLAGLDRDQPAELGLGLAQLFAEQPDQLAALRRRHMAPFEEGVMGAADCGGNVLGAGLGDAARSAGR